MTQILTATIGITLSLLPWDEPTPDLHDYESGVATYYRTGLMAEVVENKGIIVPDGMVPVALNRKGDMGREVWLVWPLSWHVDHAISVDCAQEAHYQKRIDQDRVVEVPGWLAKREGFYGWGPWSVEVWYKQPSLAMIRLRRMKIGEEL